jgi:hypothetical protein
LSAGSAAANAGPAKTNALAPPSKVRRVTPGDAQPCCGVSASADPVIVPPKRIAAAVLVGL